MDRVAAAALIISVLMPFFMSVVAQGKFPRWVNFVLTIAVCTGAGMLTMYAAGELSWASWSSQNVLVTIGLIFAGAQAVYAGYVRGSPVMTKVNEKTSF